MIYLYILLGIIAVVLLLVLFAPKEYDVRRDININRPANEVYDYLKFIKNQDYWSPWKSRDPEMKQSYEGVDGTVGFIAKWDSDKKDVGAGEQEIIGLKENERIETEIRFLKPWKSVSDGYIILRKADDDQTKVIWGFNGRNKPPINVMMLFYNMDKSVGKDFEEGLAKLKSILENNNS